MRLALLLAESDQGFHKLSYTNNVFASFYHHPLTWDVNKQVYPVFLKRHIYWKMKGVVNVVQYNMRENYKNLV